MFIEKIQRRFTRMIHDIRHLPYEVGLRLSKLGLWTLEDWRVWSDLVEVFKIVHGLSPIKFRTFFEIRQFSMIVPGDIHWNYTNLESEPTSGNISLQSES